MSDTNGPNDNLNNSPEVKDPFAGSGDVLNSNPAADIPPVMPEATAPSNTVMPTVVVPKDRSIPKWFLALFLLVFLVFIGMTVFIYKSFPAGGFAGITNPPSPAPVATKQAAIPTVTLSPTPEASDSSLLKIGVLTSTDELKDIEADIQNTNLDVMEEIRKPTAGALNTRNIP